MNCSELFNKFEFFSSNVLRGYFFHNGNLEVLKVEVGVVGFFCMHRQCRVLHFFFVVEAAAVTVGSCVAFLGCSSEVTLVVTQLAFPQVNHVSCLAVQRPWDFDVGVVDCWLVFFVH